MTSSTEPRAVGRPTSAPELIEAMVDRDSFTLWDQPIERSGADADYQAALTRSRAKSGSDEAVLTGRATIAGQPVALIVSEFAFLGGSIGRATSGRLVAAIQRATAERLPLLAAPASGGTRMQEGTPAFVTMIDISRAIVDHKAAGLPYLVYLRHPTTGGVFASWASLGHLLLAEPGALIGFLGPKVYQTLLGQPFPERIQMAENLLTHGLLDAVVDVLELRTTVGRVLRLASTVPRTPDPAWSRSGSGSTATAPSDAWSSVQLTRRPDRPGLAELLLYGAEDVTPLNGSGTGPGEEALMVALACLAGTPCVVVGQDRRAAAEHRYLGPAALRSARRGMQLAQQLGQPLVCVIDTPGAELSVAAEEGGLAAEIARCLTEMISLTVPSVTALLGAGTGGAALALLPGRRVIAAANAWLAPLPPEGASAIVHRSAAFAAELARQQRIRAVDLQADGIVSVIVPEEPPAHQDPVGFSRRIAAECARQIATQR